MRIAVLPTARAAAATAAEFVAAALRGTPDLVIGLPTGRTSVAFYRALVDLHRAGRADFARARTFNLDEFEGLAADTPGSYGRFMRTHFFDRVNLPASRAHMPAARGVRWQDAAARYEQEIAEAGGLDLCVVGLGANGHIAFNEPASALTARTHRVRLTIATRRANAHLFGGRVGAVPRRAVTMGMATIFNARTIVLLATGREKSAIVRRAFSGPVTTRVPASLLQCHPHALAVLDRAAAVGVTS